MYNFNKKNHVFLELDFIILRSIYNTGNSTLNLVIHIDTFHIFLMKKTRSKNLNQEKNFVLNHSHRCFTKFYGFLKTTENDIIGFIYEYMCNNSLNVLDKNKIDDL